MSLAEFDWADLELIQNNFERKMIDFLFLMLADFDREKTLIQKAFELETLFIKKVSQI